MEVEKWTPTCLLIRALEDSWPWQLRRSPASPLAGHARHLPLPAPSPGGAACGTARSQGINTGKGGKKRCALGEGRRSTGAATGSKVYRGFNFTFPQPMSARRLQTEPRAAARPLTPCGPAAAGPGAHRRAQAEAEKALPRPLLPSPSRGVRSRAPSSLLGGERSFSRENEGEEELRSSSTSRVGG